MIDSAFRDAFPGGAFLRPGDTAAAERVLGQAGLARKVDRAEPAGEGNMNIVLRAWTNGRSVIIKQSRPWVEKYPQISAPPERHAVEAAFYQQIAGIPDLVKAMPRFLGQAAESGAIVLEDLGDVTDLTHYYGAGPMPDSRVEPVLDYLSVLHRSRIESAVLRNRAMRRLNHAHIFDIPLRAMGGPDLDAITPGLASAADALRCDAVFTNECRRLGEMYIADGDTLLHGDIHPGSVLVTDDGLRVIDPEFAFGGPIEFDLGVLLAHMILTGRTRPESAERIASYERGGRAFSRPLTEAFAGVEIMRRIIGVAQLPLRDPLDRKVAYLEMAREMVVGPS